MKNLPGPARGGVPTPQGIKILIQTIEDLLAEEDVSADKLARLASGPVLEYILNLELRLIIRRGPGRNGEKSYLPRRLILAALEAGKSNIVSCGTPEGLRRCLIELGSELRRAGVWDSGSPLWWEPLPPMEKNGGRKGKDDIQNGTFAGFPELPRLDISDVLLPVASPPLPENRILFHEMESQKSKFTPVDGIPTKSPRVGIVSTVFRTGTSLERWCRHHFSMGVDYIVLIFDHLELDEEACVAERLRNRYSPSKLAVWSGKRLAQEDWPLSPKDWRLNDLVPYAFSGGSSCAVAARQALNATEALHAAKTDAMGGAPLDWLIHLDHDEYFYLEGNGRGGASLAGHFSSATSLDLALVRYVNHEWIDNCPKGHPRFKINPGLAREKLGAAGWARMVHHLKMEQTGPRPYFLGYFNGKSAVDVRRGFGAAGVHGWYLNEKSLIKTFLAGPSILHFQFTCSENFMRRIWSEVENPKPEGKPLFRISPIVEKGVNLVRSMQEEGLNRSEMERRLTRLYRRMSTFEKDDMEVLEEAGLIMEPDLKTIHSTDH